MSDRRANVIGTIYLLHLEPALAHAKHYLGFVPGEDNHEAVDARIDVHRTGNGSPLVRAALARPGASARLVRTWQGVTRSQERKLKDGGNVARHCPDCRPAALKRAAENQRAVRARKKEGVSG